MRKPTGKIGPTKLSTESIDFEPIAFPTSKQEIEQFIVQVFLDNAGKYFPFNISESHLNALDDFDFSLHTDDGLKYLELMEVAPLEHLHGIYANAPSSYKPYDFAEYILAKIMKKSMKYAAVKGNDICLLTYITHWAFKISDSVAAFLSHWLNKEDIIFRYVFFYSPINSAEGIIHQLVPRPIGAPVNFEPEKFKENVVHNIPPTGWKLKEQ